MRPWNTFTPSISDDERCAVFHAAHVAGAGEAVDVELVLAVRREEMIDDQSAAACRAAVLRRVASGPIPRAGR